MVKALPVRNIVLRVKNDPYATISWLLAILTALIYLVTFLGFTVWRHNLMVTSACVDTPWADYSQSSLCQAVYSWGWGAALVEASPFAAITLLLLLGIVYLLFGTSLDLKISMRGDVLRGVVYMTSIWGGVILLLIGAVHLFLLSD